MPPTPTAMIVVDEVHHYMPSRENERATRRLSREIRHAARGPARQRRKRIKAGLVAQFGEPAGLDAYRRWRRAGERGRPFAMVFAHSTAAQLTIPRGVAVALAGPSVFTDHDRPRTPTG